MDAVGEFLSSRNVPPNSGEPAVSYFSTPRIRMTKLKTLLDTAKYAMIVLLQVDILQDEAKDALYTFLSTLNPHIIGDTKKFHQIMKYQVDNRDMTNQTLDTIVRAEQLDSSEATEIINASATEIVVLGAMILMYREGSQHYQQG